MADKRWSGSRVLGVTIVVTVLVTLGIVALLVNIFERKQEARNPFYRVVELTDDTDDPDIGDKLSCRTCHDPHSYTNSRQAFMREDWPPGSTVWSRLQSWNGQASSFMANAPLSGTRSDLNSRALCVACHGYSSDSPNTLPPASEYGAVARLKP